MWVGQDAKELEGPPELRSTAKRLAAYLEAVGRHPGDKLHMFGKTVLPYEKTTDEFWWAVLLVTKPFRGVYGSEQPLISAPDVNKSQTPREEATLLDRAKLVEHGLDVDWMFDDSAPEVELSVVQIDPTTNFLDKSVYKQIKIKAWKFVDYVITNKLVPYTSEVPKFLDYDLNIFGNTIAKCLKLESKQPELRNSAANLLTIDKKNLEAPMDVYGKVFVVAEGLDLQPPEVFEIVIFCMGQAEAAELKLTSWVKLKDALQEEARKFALSAQHIRRRAR